MTDEHWSETHDNIVALATHLVHEEGWDAHQLLELIEKPWHFDAEWTAYKEGKVA
jgi:hypothetical protein